MTLNRTDSIAVLDALAPPPGWETSLALVSSYSVDLVAAAALVISLAGEGRDHEDMRQAPLARACERMRGRFRVVCQAGRVSVPEQRSQSALVLADRWIREVHRDGRLNSWHAKLALVRYQQSDEPDTVMWRLWVGSRNLTQDTSWDSALVAVGHPGRGAAISRSVAHAGRLLAEHAELALAPAEVVEAELNGVAWEWPSDVSRLRSFALWSGGDDSPAIPAVPRNAEQVVAIGPFCDGATLKILGARGSKQTKRWLLSTRATLDRVASQQQDPLRGFSELYAMDAASPEDGAREGEAGDEEQFAEVHRGLHAKLLFYRTPREDVLWLGSANLTQRAWGGGNAECMLELVVDPSVGEGLMNDFVKELATVVLRTELAEVPPDEEEVEQRLDDARNRIAAAWSGVSLQVREGALWCQSAAPLLEPGGDVRLRVGLLGSRGLHDWPAGALGVELPLPARHLVTELVVLELWADEDPDQQVRWVARAPLTPPPGLDRDRAALSHLMGPRAFLTWLRTLLEEVVGDSADERWPPRRQNKSATVGGGHDALALRAPSLEAVLRAWARDRAAVVRVDRAVQRWAKDIRAAKRDSDEPREQRALEELEVFESNWQVLREGLELTAEAT